MITFPCVILAGGLGTRLRESSEYKPKPMIELDSKPILWHIMKSYNHYGVKDFVISSGYKSEYIKNYFLHYNSFNQDFKLDLATNQVTYYGETENWNVTVSDTGLSTMTGGRISKIKKYISSESFFCTYGDGVSDVDIRELFDFHQAHGKVATMMVVRQPSRFGVVDLKDDLSVSSFREKPIVDGWVNAGYFIFKKQIFDYLNEDSILENEPLRNLAIDGELVAFKHDGYWQAMDTFREQQLLEKLILEKRAPWIKWDSQ
jgi:glucose-1-phosphate cytidylyltransferase